MSTFTCPKRMVHGPCAGLGADGSCEVAAEPCVFLGQPVVAFVNSPAAEAQLAAVAHWTTEDERATGMGMRALLRRGRVVVADFPAAALDVRSIAESAEILRGRVDAVLAGDSPRNRVQLPPAYRASLIRQAGLAAWAGLNCRDRNRVAIEGELAGLAHVGVAGVHCVTGDHPAVGSRPDAAAVFDLDSTEVAALAHAAGLLVSVAESPASPPTSQRPARLVEKVRAGAEVCYVNHCGGPSAVADFIASVQTLGADPWFVACVPVVVNRASAEFLASLPSLVLPSGFLDRIVASHQPRRTGIDAAVELAQSMLAMPGVAGVNLSGGGAPGEELAFAADLAEISSRLQI
jgi:5,10-methylenetetrahydrofolate reductase